MAAELREIAKAFVDARKNGTVLAEYPGNRPSDLATAYAIQDCALSLWEREVGGWKVGKINPPQDELLGANRLVGPAFADQIFLAGEKRHVFPIFAGGFGAVEAEYMLRIAPQGGDLPCDPEKALAWVDEVRIGIEIASSPYAAINADGPCVTVSDHGNNAGLLLGPAIPPGHWPALNSVQVSLDVNGKTVGQATTATMLDGPFGAVSFLLRNLEQRNIEPRAGWWVSSGAITGVHEVQRGDLVEARFESIGALEIGIA